uniref:Putative ovule protein n=1 Tax=Solanum chacoense TaxID=4108 RepID=A0A0V0HMG3_SOLCH
MHSALFCFPDFSIYVVENFVLLCKLASMKRYFWPQLLVNATSFLAQMLLNALPFHIQCCLPFRVPVMHLPFTFNAVYRLEFL